MHLARDRDGGMILSYFDCSQLFRQRLHHQFTLVLTVCSLYRRAKGGKRLPLVYFISGCHRYILLQRRWLIYSN